MNIPAIIKSSVSKIFLKEKGDLATATDDGQLGTLSVGSDGTVLTADSSQPTGLNWVTVAAASGALKWGSITGTLSNQNDLENALDGKEPANANIQGHIATTGNPHGTTKAEIGLSNVTDEAQIPKGVGTAKGSLIGFSASGAPLEVPVGADTKVLTADATQPSGVAWKDAPGDAPAWGNIIGTLNSQTDLQTALQNKSDVNHTHISAQVGLANVTDDKQVKAAAISVAGNLVSWSGTTGDTVADSGNKISDLALANHNHNGVYEPANANIQPHITSTANPHNVTAIQVLPNQAGQNGKFLTSNGTTVSWGDPSAGTPPTGDGFRHVTAGAEDPAAKLVANADVDPAAAITESKLSLNFSTHSNANDPAIGEKAALAGTSGTPGAGNLYVTNADPRNNNARPPTIHGSSAHSGAIGTPDQVGLGNVTNDAQIAKSVGTAKGSLIGFSTSSAPLEVPVGANGKVLVADSTQASGIAWKSLDQAVPEILALPSGTSPSLSGGNIFTVTSPSPRTISNFTNAVVAQTYTLIFADSNTTLDFTSSNLYRSDGLAEDLNMGANYIATLFILPDASITVGYGVR
jgi:hypothetical protein